VFKVYIEKDKIRINLYSSYWDALQVYSIITKNNYCKRQPYWELKNKYNIIIIIIIIIIIFAERLPDIITTLVFAWW